MDRNTTVALVAMGLVFLFMLPSWTPVVPSINITEARLSNSSLTFRIKYSAPWSNSCFVVVYGPFTFDKPGHEEGNNIYVLRNRQGELSDTLKLRPGATLERLKAELWCDWDKLGEAEFSLR